MTGDGSVTDEWLAAVADVMPALEGPAGTAERLLLLVHYGVNWRDGWVSARRVAYWDQLLPDRVVAATFRAPDLPRWWSDVSGWLESSPRNQRERVEVERLLRAPDQVQVLQVLRLQTAALVLRVRIVAETVRAARAPQDQGEVDG